LAVLIVASKRDVAAQNIARQLTVTKGFRQVQNSSDLFQQGDVLLKHVETDSIDTNDLEIDAKIDLVIFASRHKSESGEPTLTVHWPGNPTSRAEFGGTPRTLSFADPPRLRAALLAFDEARERMKLAYVVSLEATHHGPTEWNIPTLFVEVGSTEREWNDLQAAAAASEAIWKTATDPIQGKSAIGFGGGHYCNKQTLAVRRDGYAFGHILSKYFFEEYEEEIVHMAFNHTIGDCDTAVIDWKGIRSPDRNKLLRTLREINKAVVRV
jgi:D-aminoacyl-tRNA deacylase